MCCWDCLIIIYINSISTLSYCFLNNSYFVAYCQLWFVPGMHSSKLVKAQCLTPDCTKRNVSLLNEKAATHTLSQYQEAWLYARPFRYSVPSNPAVLSKKMKVKRTSVSDGEIRSGQVKLFSGLQIRRGLHCWPYVLHKWRLNYSVLPRHMPVQHFEVKT